MHLVRRRTHRSLLGRQSDSYQPQRGRLVQVDEEDSLQCKAVAHLHIFVPSASPVASLVSICETSQQNLVRRQAPRRRYQSTGAISGALPAYPGHRAAGKPSRARVWRRLGAVVPILASAGPGHTVSTFQRLAGLPETTSICEEKVDPARAGHSCHGLHLSQSSDPSSSVVLARPGAFPVVFEAP